MTVDVTNKVITLGPLDNKPGILARCFSIYLYLRLKVSVKEAHEFDRSFVWLKQKNMMKIKKYLRGRAITKIHLNNLFKIASGLMIYNEDNIHEKDGSDEVMDYCNNYNGCFEIIADIRGEHD